MRSKGQECVFTRHVYTVFHRNESQKKPSKSEDNSIALIKFIDVENQAILKFNKELGGANNSTTLRSISFIFHVCQNSIMLRFTKAKQLLPWLQSALIERVNMVSHCSDLTVDMLLS